MISLFLDGFSVGAPYHEGPRFFLFLTNWMFIEFAFYSIWSAMSVTLSYICAFTCEPSILSQDPDKGGPCNHELIIDDRPQGCCGRTSDRTLWYHKIHWFLFTVAVHMSFSVALLYWIVLYTPVVHSFYYGNIAAHIVVPIIGLADLFVTGIPWRILHVIYPATFASSWVIFSGIYFCAGGTNYEGMAFIYPILNYRSSLGRAILIIIALVLIAIPIIHQIMYGLYLLRELLLFLFKKASTKFSNATSEYTKIPKNKRNYEGTELNPLRSK